MMETARIRRAGYPMRHAYRAFVERYRLLIPRTGPLDQCDCRALARQICEAALSADSDRQFGRTKLFLRDADDALLEAERSRVMLKCIETIQRGIRRMLFRRYLRKYRQAIITVQRHWRGRAQRKRYQIMRRGFHRLGACIAAQQLTAKFTMVRSRTIKLQALCRGFLARKRFREELAVQRVKQKELKKQQKLQKEQELLRLKELELLRQKQQAEEQQRLKQQQEQAAAAAAAEQLRLKQQQEQAAAAAVAMAAEQLRLKQQHEQQQAQRLKEQVQAQNAIAMAAVQQPKRSKSFKRAEQPEVLVRSQVLPAPTLQARMSLPPPPPMSPVLILPMASRPASNGVQSRGTNGNGIGNNTNGNGVVSPGYMDVESSKQIVDDVFGFLNDEPDVSGPLGPNVKEKSLLFERELRLRKDVPTKLLSRPVNYYEAAPRKIVNQTRL